MAADPNIAPWTGRPLRECGQHASFQFPEHDKGYCQDCKQECSDVDPCDGCEGPYQELRDAEPVQA